MTLTQLSYVVALAEQRHFAHAAAACFVSQPTLSAQLQKLEEELGMLLFDRSKHPVEPTAQGAKIVEQARVVLVEARRLESLASAMTDSLEGELHLAFIPTLAPYLVPTFLGLVSKELPGLRLNIYEITTDEILERLKNGSIDMAVLATPLLEEVLEERVLFYEQFVAYVSENEPEFSLKNIEPTQIPTRKLWLLDEGHCARIQVLNICAIKDLEREKPIQYSTGNIETLKRLVEENGGLTIVPELAVRGMGEEQFDRVRYFKSPVPVRQVGLVCSKSYPRKSLLSKVESILKEVVPKEMLKNLGVVSGIRLGS